MVEKLRSWLSENTTLVTFLAAQLIFLGSGAAWMLAYSVRLETRVTILETRGAEYSVDRMNKTDQKLTAMEGSLKEHENSDQPDAQRTVERQTPMTAANYDACISKVLKYEGGYQNDPNDKGNWTGCKVGAGVNKGTNRGISACTYPNEDIKGMTEARAKEIYRADFWDAIQGDALPAGPDLCTFDGSVNSGQSRGVKWLQRAVGAVEDGVVGPQTIAAANAADDNVTIDRMCDDRMDFLRGLSTWPTYGKGWTSRVEDVRKTAHGMVSDEPVRPLEPEPQVVTITIDAPPGVVVKVEQIEH